MQSTEKNFLSPFLSFIRAGPVPLVTLILLQHTRVTRYRLRRKPASIAMGFRRFALAGMPGIDICIRPDELSKMQNRALAHANPAFL